MILEVTLVALNRISCLIAPHARYKTYFCLHVALIAHNSCSWLTEWTMTKLCCVMSRYMQ